MRKISFICLLCVFIFLGCSRKDETKQIGKTKDNKVIEVTTNFVAKEKRQIANYNKDLYPQKAEDLLKKEFAVGLPVIEPNQFHKVVKVIDKLEPLLKKALQKDVSLEKLQWEVNMISQKAGFKDLADYIENFVLLANAFGTYEKITILDSLVFNRIDNKVVKLYEEKVRANFNGQKLTKNDVRFMHKHKEDFTRITMVMDTFAKNMMQKEF
ncbi:MAG: hypothetical protein KAS49_03735 [Candidatus Cloacimonetes bacterium]|nr:hypothetical protein [Candidatus Cloacimonadota bacterium]